MWMGTNDTSRMAPSNSVAVVAFGATNAVMRAAASRVTALIASRATSIGSVNAIDSATAAYCGHAARRINPLTVTRRIHATRPAITASVIFSMRRVYAGHSH